RVPDNLVLINENQILEEIIVDYDAVITMWSTAFLDAIALNMPLMLIGGFDSDDVFDIRTNRVQDAYDELAESGVLVDFRDIMDKPLEFKPVSTDFQKKELINFDKPCSPFVVDLFETVNNKLIIPDLRYAGFFEVTYRDIAKTLDEIKLYDMHSAEYLRWKETYTKFNELMQEYVYINRCMGNIFDLSDMTAVMENCKVGDSIDVEKLLADKFAEIEDSFYNNLANIEKAKEDKILFDFYCDWLYRKGRLAEIANFEGTHDEVQEEIEYYTAIHCLKLGRQGKAIQHITQYLTCLVAKNKKAELLKEKRMYDYTKPFLDVKHRFSFIKYLCENKKVEELELLNFTVLQRDPMTAYLKMKMYNGLGDYEKAVEIYDTLVNSPNSQPSISKIIAKNLFTNKVEIEYNYANKNLVKSNDTEK
ncbi:MAG: hypothetical protein IJ643_00080, partial [Eubacterium sp.]|nr:hypothetical protein [Eubacterium sp.]